MTTHWKPCGEMVTFLLYRTPAAILSTVISKKVWFMWVYNESLYLLETNGMCLATATFLFSSFVSQLDVILCQTLPSVSTLMAACLTLYFFLCHCLSFSMNSQNSLWNYMQIHNFFSNGGNECFDWGSQAHSDISWWVEPVRRAVSNEKSSFYYILPSSARFN